jgi:hypothetical protein
MVEQKLRLFAVICRCFSFVATVLHHCSTVLPKTKNMVDYSDLAENPKKFRFYMGPQPMAYNSEAGLYALKTKHYEVPYDKVRVRPKEHSDKEQDGSRTG